MTALRPTGKTIPQSWKVLGFLALFLGLCLPGLISYSRAKLQEYRRKREQQLLVSFIQAEGIRCSLSGEDDGQSMYDLQIQGQLPFDRFVRLVGQDHRAEHLRSVTSFKISSVKISSTDLEQLKDFHPDCPVQLEFIDCTLPPEFLQWLAPMKEVHWLIFTHCRFEPQLPPPPGGSIQIDALKIDSTPFGDDDLILLWRENSFSGLEVRNFIPGRRAVETLAAQVPSPFQHLYHVDLEAVPLEPWLPVVSRLRPSGTLILSHCEMNSCQLEQLGADCEDYQLGLQGRITPELLLGLSQQQNLSLLYLMGVDIDDRWDYAFSELPYSLRRLSIRHSRIASFTSLLQLPPTVKTVSFYQNRVEETSWLKPPLNRWSNARPSINPGWVLRFDIY